MTGFAVSDILATDKKCQQKAQYTLNMMQKQ